MALATLSDLEDRGVDVSDPTRIDALLADASAAVIAATGCDFERAERTKVVWPTRGYFTLRGVNVASVSAIDEESNTLDLEQVETYRWFAGTCRKATVTYTEGWATVPDAVTAVVCSMVARAVSVDPSQYGHSQDTAGPFSFTVGTAAASGAVAMLPDEARMLARYTKKPGTVTGAAWADGL